jgi:hypothetical protein
MTGDETTTDRIDPTKRGGSPYRVRLPGFVSDAEIGLGDLIKQTTSVLGVQPCGRCEQRAARLNRWLAFSPWQRR